MKIVLFLSWILMLTNAWSFPAVGDFVRYESQYEGKTYAIEKKVLRYFEQSNSFEVRNLRLWGDEVISDEIFNLPKSFLYSPEKIGHVLSTCLEREGAPGEFVLGGKLLKVCEFYNEQSFLTDILGMVPFGQIRFQVYLGGEEFLDFYLVKFRNGEL